MITACIHTQIRTVNVPCDNDRNKAIAALQQSVFDITKEDGRCKFVVSEWGTEVYSWEYQPTFREEKKKVVVKKEPEYCYDYVIYILLNGKELDYDNFYAEGQYFNLAVQAHEFMKERGYRRYDYKLVYEYGASSIDGKHDYGFGLGFTKTEAIEKLNQSLSYYNLQLKNGQIREI